MPKASVHIREWEEWYQFKDDLEATVGFYIPVSVWVEIRPKRSLPWNEIDFQILVSRISNSGTIRARANAGK
jgi:hypothetical protein